MLRSAGAELLEHVGRYDGLCFFINQRVDGLC
jgi:hypothetical protein